MKYRFATVLCSLVLFGCASVAPEEAQFRTIVKNSGWSYPKKARPEGPQHFVFTRAPAWQGTKLYAELSGKVVRIDLAHANECFSAAAEGLSTVDALLAIQKGLEDVGFIFSPVKDGFEVIRSENRG